MSSAPSPLVNKAADSAYHKNQIRSISFLVLLTLALLIAVLLSLRAGSYNTPIGELIKGIFGKSADKKSILWYRTTAFPESVQRFWQVPGWALLVVFYRRSYTIPWHPHLLWVCPKVRHSVRRLPLLCWGLEVAWV